MWKAMFLRNVKLYFKDKAMFFTSLIKIGRASCRERV